MGGAGTRRGVSVWQAEQFKRTFGGVTDEGCQDNGKCRKLARNFPTYVNLTSFEQEFTKGVRHVMKQLSGCPFSAL